MPINREGWLLTNEVLDYIKEKHDRHWTRFYLYTLLKKSNIKVEKMGHINLYSQRSIDDYISLLKRPSSNGGSAKFKKSVSIH